MRHKSRAALSAGCQPPYAGNKATALESFPKGWQNLAFVCYLCEQPDDA
jgi:hypothetical protein